MGCIFNQVPCMTLHLCKQQNYYSYSCPLQRIHILKLFLLVGWGGEGESWGGEMGVGDYNMRWFGFCLHICITIKRNASLFTHRQHDDAMFE